MRFSDKDPLEILYQDNHLFVVNKPANLLTQPTEQESDSLEKLSKEWIKENYDKKGNVYLHAIHRLDKPVSGLVLFARTSKALTRMNLFMRERKMRKIYHAIVRGNLKEDKGYFRDCIKHDEFKSVEHVEGKEAILHYSILERWGTYFLLEIELETGRYHQIRSQLGMRDIWILGDRKYGSSEVYFPGEIALHHYEMTILHPVNNEKMAMRAPYPSHFKGEWDRIKKRTG